VPTIKNAATAEGGYFDPHTHYTGIIPYRVLSILTPEGKLLLRRWQQANPTAALRDLPVGHIEEFLARHRLPDGLHLRPFHAEGQEEEAKAKAGVLYDLETRLLILQALGLSWGLETLPVADFKRVRENSGTLVAIVTGGTKEIQQRFTGALATHGTALLKNRPADGELQAICDEILALSIPQATEADYNGGLPKLVRHVCQNVLTATPQNDYDSAYVGRGLLQCGIQDQMDAGIRELARQNILYSEQSLPIWSLTGKWDLDGVRESIARAEQNGLVVRWLPMLVGSFLGWIGDSHEDPFEPRTAPKGVTPSWSMLRLYDATGSDRSADQPPKKVEVTPWEPEERDGVVSCLARYLALPHDDWTLRWAEIGRMNWPVREQESFYQDFGAWLDKLEAALSGGVRHIAGFDIASPERTWYTTHGGLLLIRILDRVFKVAKRTDTRLVAHIHVGEGYPGFVDNRLASESIAAQAKRPEQVPLRILYDKQTHLPAHYLCAENNVQVMLDAVQKFRKLLGTELADFDRRVRVRFGHVTHATLVQAQQMADAGIWADVNLTSNLATGALSFPGQVEGDTAVPLNRSGMMKRAAELVNQTPNQDLFRHHALVTLLTSGVPTVLGTDGGGIEHSEMSREYALATAVLTLARDLIGQERFTILSSAKVDKAIKLGPADADALRTRLSEATLYRAQAAHYAWMQGENPPAPITPARSLDHTLFTAFQEAMSGY
jgi:hypothetical protein